jgi:protein-tyrosine phosphatase
MILDEIEDDGNQNILNVLPIGMDFIGKALDENESNKVLVHCAAGISRSGAFCVAYMIKKE